MKSNRLLMLANHLDKVSLNEFDLSVWWCETAGCAMGHACSIPAFRRLGLVINGDDPLSCPSFHGHWGMGAASHLFGISYAEANYLFSAGHYRYGGRTRPRTVANRIRKFVQKKERTKSS